MNTYRLDPIDVESASWKYSQEKYTVWTRAASIKDARDQVAACTGFSAASEPGAVSPWQDGESNLLRAGPDHEAIPIPAKSSGKTAARWLSNRLLSHTPLRNTGTEWTLAASNRTEHFAPGFSHAKDFKGGCHGALRQTCFRTNGR